MNLVLEGTSGKVYFANGRGGYCDFQTVTLDDALARFDRYAEWVKAGNGGPDDDASPKYRDLIVTAHGMAARMSGGGA